MRTMTRRAKTSVFLLLVLLPVAWAAGAAWAAAGPPEDLLRRAEAGDAKAQYRLGGMYEYGRAGAPKDYRQAFFWYKKAAEQGYAPGQRGLGKCYELGLGVKADPSKAAYWYKKAADQGLARAQVNLGILYETGVGVEQDYDQAVYWYKKSVQRGYPRGQYYLGRMYERGLGVPKDLAKARAWYQKAAKAKYSRAIRRLRELDQAGTQSAAQKRPAALPKTPAPSSKRPAARPTTPAPPPSSAKKPAPTSKKEMVPSPPVTPNQAPGAVVTPPLEPEPAPPVPAVLPGGEAEDHFYLGNALAREGRFQEAVAEYRRALELEPESASTLENLGITYAKMGKIAEGIRYLRQAVAADPLDGGKYAALGIMLHAQGDIDGAMREYRQAIRRDPTQAGVYYNMTTIFAEQGDYRRAWQSLHLAERFGKEAGELRRRLAEFAPEPPPNAWPLPADGFYLRAIVTASRGEAQDILDRLRRGEDFAALARRHSLAPTRLDGGYLGFVKQTEMEPAVAAAVASLPPFALSEPVETADGVAIFQRLVMPEELLR